MMNFHNSLMLVLCLWSRKLIHFSFCCEEPWKKGADTGI
jgi:hypothetical protein